MIDLKLLRSDAGLFRDAFARRGSDVDVDALLALEEKHRALIADVEKGRAEQNAANKRISQVSGDERQAAIAEAKQISDRFKGMEEELRKAREELEGVLTAVPNLVHPETPAGAGEENYAILREVGERKEGGEEHHVVGASLGIIDTDRAAKVSGSRFGILKGKGALLEMALVRFALDRVMAHGFEPVIPPVLVREDAMFGTGFFPTDEAQIYKTAADDLYLAGTSEVPLASMHRDEVLEELPVRYAGFSTCFRREAGTYGKDTKGIIRLHQFDKVEMFIFCPAEESNSQHLKILAIEEEIFQALEIPYRVVEVPAGELGAPAYRKFDLEAWLPGARRWLEVTSCSNCTDYQSRRLNIRAKGDSGSALVHTLNGTTVAVQRTIVSLIENHQHEGKVEIPAALRPYTGFDSIG